ncbi:MAG: ferredoxin family protein [Thermoanaerobaculia bacterium]|nr:ferredoxin family protein [Thermoanaerobaculia bacterium]
MSALSDPTNPLDANRLRVLLDAEGSRRAELLPRLLAQGVAVTATGSGTVAPLDDAELLYLCDADDSAQSTVEIVAGEGEAEGISGSRIGIRGLDADSVADGVLERARGEGHGEPAGGWTPWFPVIDYDRCTNCMQCLSFCLFGVYDVDDEQRIDVAQPQRCKTNCPACSRVCPEVAILFPKYRHGPINGDQVQAHDVEREKMKVDVSALLGGDIYSLLRQRHERAESRFSKERDDDRALKERQRCLKKLQEDLDIPDDVLSSLPSAEQIRAKAAARGASVSPAESTDPATAPTTSEDTP